LLIDVKLIENYSLRGGNFIVGFLIFVERDFHHILAIVGCQHLLKHQGELAAWDAAVGVGLLAFLKQAAVCSIGPSPLHAIVIGSNPL
jgi:hypothetical protein